MIIRTGMQLGDRVGRNKVPVKCSNLFKNGAKAPTKEQYTKKWVTLIQRLEQNGSRVQK